MTLNVSSAIGTNAYGL